MMEYVVDCAIVPHPTDHERALVLPVSIASHVHERLVRCRDCDHCIEYEDWMPCVGLCKLKRMALLSLDEFCSRAKPREDAA